MNWKKLTEVEALEEIKSKSFDNPILIYKHSTRCSVSSMVLNRLERSWDDQEMQNIEIYFLDLIAHRDVSNQIESVFGISHESPQILLISSGKCVYNASHMGISYRELKNELGSTTLAM
ncbi:bacillithiol system redox-active protein YtxJ [Reichenbachiella sp. MALMAid0571]|uniref:bacillithiol system redox-active protein YtxJ n=1 Tax=Reichenbachiella sp. MALMAid0571 TaxID=3143939 RepID=UPI0032DFE81B